MKILISIPTYNEADNIITLLDQIRQNTEDLDVTILIIDDNSPDGTAKLVMDYEEINELSIELIQNQKKSGLAGAYLQAFKFGISNNFDKVITMDADLSHPPRFLPNMISASQQNNLVIGSRYVPGGKIENWSLVRKFISKYGNIYSKAVLGVDINDLTGGFNCYDIQILRDIDLERIKSHGYSFQIEMKYKAVKMGHSFTEIPITFPDRVEGKSKLDRSIVFEAIFTPWKLRFLG
jgi:dolichol-phosphate mannosyltransferase